MTHYGTPKTDDPTPEQIAKMAAEAREKHLAEKRKTKTGNKDRPGGKSVAYGCRNGRILKGRANY